MEEGRTILFYLVTLVAATSSTFLRGFQNKNVVGGYTKLAFFTGYGMAVADALIIGMIVKVGIEVALISGFGAGIGYVLSMYAHTRLTRNRTRQEKLRQKEKLRKQVYKTIDQHLEQRKEAKRDRKRNRASAH